jgi:hypothetical protein
MVSRFPVLAFRCERRACIEITILFFEHDGRVEEPADASRSQNLALRPLCRNPSVADQDNALDLRTISSMWCVMRMIVVPPRAT